MEEKLPVSESRDWLILSLKWSRDDFLVWYRTARANYTSSLLHAGRYTEEEARAEETRVPHCVMAVKLDAACGWVDAQMVLPNDGRLIQRLKRESRAKSPAGEQRG